MVQTASVIHEKSWWQHGGQHEGHLLGQMSDGLTMFIN